MADRDVINLGKFRLDAVIEEHNVMVDGLRAQGLGSHETNTGADATAVSTDAATALVLANALRTAYVAHIADTDAHEAADGTNTVTAPLGTDTATAITLANELKADVNAHGILAASHYRDYSQHAVNGVFVAINTADATDAATLVVLANDLQDAYNAHVKDAARKFANEADN